MKWKEWKKIATKNCIQILGFRKAKKDRRAEKKQKLSNNVTTTYLILLSFSTIQCSRSTFVALQSVLHSWKQKALSSRFEASNNKAKILVNFMFLSLLFLHIFLFLVRRLKTSFFSFFYICVSFSLLILM